MFADIHSLALAGLYEHACTVGAPKTVQND